MLGSRKTPFSLCFALVASLAAVPAVAQQAKSPPDSSPGYGKTPAEVVPYRDFGEPYTRFFETATPFRGTGRGKNKDAQHETVRIGFFAPLGEAPDADLGEFMLEGTKLAIEQANAAGGYNGIPFELVMRPDTGLWGATSNEMVAFRYEDDVLAVIGSVDGANTHIALRVALKIETPMVNTATTDPTLTETNIPWLLRCMADDRQQGYALAHHMFVECGIDRVAAVRVNDRYGRMGIGEFRDAARRLKHPLRVEMRWNRGERAFERQLDRLAKADPEAVVIWGNAADAAAVVRVIRDRGMSVRVFGCDRLASQAFLRAAGDAAEGVVAVASEDPTSQNERRRAFVEAFKQHFGHEPETFAAHGYDGTNILVKAIRKAGLNRARIRDALYEFKQYDGVTGPITFDATLNDVGPVYLATVKDGAFTYERANFLQGQRVSQGNAPYRSLAETPPVARSPAREPVTGQAYRLGCLFPADENGRSARKGVELAIADDAAAHGDDVAIELVFRASGARAAGGGWGTTATAVTELALRDNVLAVIGSTRREGTHLAEMVAAKFHFPVITLCDDDPSITQIPLPWVFNVAPGDESPDAGFLERFVARYGEAPDAFAALGYDAGALVASRIRAGADNRRVLRDALASLNAFAGVSGRFRFDGLGNRVPVRGNDGAPGDAPIRLGRR